MQRECPSHTIEAEDGRCLLKGEMINEIVERINRLTHEIGWDRELGEPDDEDSLYDVLYQLTEDYRSWRFKATDVTSDDALAMMHGMSDDDVLDSLRVAKAKAAHYETLSEEEMDEEAYQRVFKPR